MYLCDNVNWQFFKNSTGAHNWQTSTVASITPKPTIVFTLIAAGRPTKGTFSDPVMNFMSCIASTWQVTKTKTKKAEYFEDATKVYMFQKRFEFHDSRQEGRN